jgi:hypothetical protein
VNTDAETRCNTNANTDAATQMQTQMLQHKCENRDGTQKLTQMVKVVIDDNRLVMEHAQVLEHRS